MKKVTRRQMITTGFAGAAGASGLAVAAHLADRYGLIPPDSSGIYGPGHTLTYASQKLLTRHSFAREFSRDAISTPFATGRIPKAEKFKRMQTDGFTDWAIAVDGMVERPTKLSLAQLKSLPSSTQITQLTCEEGWSFIAEWTGVPLSHVLNMVGVLPEAKFVAYYSMQPTWFDSIDMSDALHPQTFVTYGMNGADLPVPHGGPLRLRVPRQLGYKSVKYITRLTVTDKPVVVTEGGYSWYAGI